MVRSIEDVRILTIDDVRQIERLLQTSEYIYQRFMLDELLTILQHYPAMGVFHGTSMQACLMTQAANGPLAWIGGFCVNWTSSRAYARLLELLLGEMTGYLIARRVHYLHYSGNDTKQDWLRDVLLTRGFAPYRYLYAYDKYDFGIPSWGNRQVTVRAAGVGDIAALLGIEAACFDALWRYDALSFGDILRTHPYFVVAELDGKVVGYQFNATENENGYLIRIAVHPSVEGQGIGCRLMAEAVQFFKRERVERLMLNTQDDNTNAHRLYEWFGFERLPQVGFVLRKVLR